MAEDFEGIYDTEDLDDAELLELIEEKLAEAEDVNTDFVEIVVEDHAVQLTGRVGTEQELQRLDEILEDELGLVGVDNGVVVDESVRTERAEAADDAAAEAAEARDDLGGDGTRGEPSAAHLRPDPEGELHGTHDLQKALERGESYTAPERAPQFGSRSREQH